MKYILCLALIGCNNYSGKKHQVKFTRIDGVEFTCSIPIEIKKCETKTMVFFNCVPSTFRCGLEKE